MRARAGDAIRRIGLGVDGGMANGVPEDQLGGVDDRGGWMKWGNAGEGSEWAALESRPNRWTLG